MRAPSAELDRVNIRLPDGLRDRLKAAARHSGRSANAEMIHRLESSFEAVASLHPEIAGLLDQHIDREVQKRLQAIAASIGGQSVSEEVR